MLNFNCFSLFLRFLKPNPQYFLLQASRNTIISRVLSQSDTQHETAKVKGGDGGPVSTAHKKHAQRKVKMKAAEISIDKLGDGMLGLDVECDGKTEADVVDKIIGKKTQSHLL